MRYTRSVDVQVSAILSLLFTCINEKCIGDSAFGAASPRLWNNLPVNIRASGTLSVFRKCLKTYLFIRHFN